MSKKVPWIAELVRDMKMALDLNLSSVEARVPSGSLCPACKGIRMLCRKASCPIVASLYAYLKIRQSTQRLKIDGSSPPGVFVGRIGYPKVFLGPMVPPVHGDTSIYDLPEAWFGKTMDEIVDFRFQLIRGMQRFDSRKPELGGRVLDDTRLLAMAESSVDVEMSLVKPPHKTFVINDEVQPMGPSAPIRDMKASSMRIDKRMEKAFYDVDLKAADAVTELYVKGVPVSRIQKALSVGAFGLRRRRRLVPTRWSITAVDSMLSIDIIDKIKEFPVINEYRLYESTYLGNRFEVLLLPDAWKYEAIEAWYPGTIWNPYGGEIFLFGDWEDRDGRSTYAKMGGCYYAARLAVGELLLRERRQATAIVLREAHPEYIMPVGVWQVRENVRNALRGKPLKFSRFEDLLNILGQRFDIPLKKWLENSYLITTALKQTKLTKFINVNSSIKI
jgi:hypothetical protein